MYNLRGKNITYITELDGFTVEETALVDEHEGNKIYVIDEYGNKNTFNTKTGYCYTDNPTFGAKKYLKV